MTLQPDSPDGLAFRLSALEGRVRSLEQQAAQCLQDRKAFSVVASWPWRRLRWWLIEGWHPYEWGKRWRK